MKNFFAILGATAVSALNIQSEYDTGIVGAPFDNLTTLQYNTMLAGIVWGFLDKEGLTEVETCITDARAEATLAFEGFVELTHGEWETAMITLLSVMETLPTLSTDCHSMSDDFATLEAWGLNLYQQPDLEGYIRHNVTRHIIGLTADLNKARNYYADGQYWDFGNELGLMLAIVTQ